MSIKEYEPKSCFGKKIKRSKPLSNNPDYPKVKIAIKYHLIKNSQYIEKDNVGRKDQYLMYPLKEAEKLKRHIVLGG